MRRADRRAIYERDAGLCGFCGQPVPFESMHLDHAVPRGLGGSNSPENQRVAHRRCNIAAGQSVITERRRLGLPRMSSSGTLIRNVPAELWHRVRKAAAVESTPEKRATMRDVVLEALNVWLAKKGY